MNLMIQQIASNAEESASGAEELSGQADELKNMIFTFRLSGGHAFAASPGRIQSTAPGKKIRATAVAANLPDKESPHTIPGNAADVIPFGEPDAAESDRFWRAQG